MNNNYISQNKKRVSKKGGIILVFANLFNMWFNRKQLDSDLLLNFSLL